MGRPLSRRSPAAWTAEAVGVPTGRALLQRGAIRGGSAGTYSFRTLVLGWLSFVFFSKTTFLPN